VLGIDVDSTRFDQPHDIPVKNVQVAAGSAQPVYRAAGLEQHHADLLHRQRDEAAELAQPDHRVAGHLVPQAGLLGRQVEVARQGGDQPVPDELPPPDLEVAGVVEEPGALDDGEFLGGVRDDGARLGVPDRQAEGPLEVELVYRIGRLVTEVSHRPPTQRDSIWRVSLAGKGGRFE
jgi:hypothetical protein